MMLSSCGLCECESSVDLEVVIWEMGNKESIGGFEACLADHGTYTRGSFLVDHACRQEESGEQATLHVGWPTTPEASEGQASTDLVTHRS
jgi:hypothetical protein